MIPFTPTIRAYAELARLSNLPTVVTNVLVGVALATAAAPIRPATVAIIAGAMALLYIAGMALNDVVDARIDAIERPGRPIPSGRISRQAATIFAAICMLGALYLMARFGRGAFGLTATLCAMIVVYDLAHKKLAASVVLMGACRALVYLCAAAAIAWPLQWPRVAPPASAIFLYIVLLTIIARMEAKPTLGPRAWLALILPLPAFAVIAAFPPAPDRLLLPVVCGGVLFIWLTRSSMNLFKGPRGTIAAVHGWLAGICLVDAWFLALLDEPWPVVACLVCFIVTALGHRRIMGT